MSNLTNFRKKKVDAADGCKQGYTTETFDGCTPSCKCKDGTPVKMWNQTSSGPNVGKGCCPAMPTPATPTPATPAHPEAQHILRGIHVGYPSPIPVPSLAPTPVPTHEPTYSCETKYGPNKIYNQNYVLEKRWPDLGPYKSPEEAKSKCPQKTWDCAKFSQATTSSCTENSDGSGRYKLNLGTNVEHLVGGTVVHPAYGGGTTQVYTSSADVTYLDGEGVNDLKDSCENSCIQPPTPELGATILRGRCETNMTLGMSTTYKTYVRPKTAQADYDNLKDCITFCKNWNTQAVGELGNQATGPISCTCWLPKDMDTWVYTNKGESWSGCNTSFILD
jgi:hypothetical protein